MSRIPDLLVAFGAATLFALAGLALAAARAEAEGAVCMPHADMLATLAVGHSEVVVGMGAVNGGGLLLELYASQGGTWSIVTVRRRDGLSCLIAAGDGLLLRPEVLDPPSKVTSPCGRRCPSRSGRHPARWRLGSRICACPVRRGGRSGSTPRRAGSRSSAWFAPAPMGRCPSGRSRIR